MPILHSRSPADSAPASRGALAKTPLFLERWLSGLDNGRDMLITA